MNKQLGFVFPGQGSQSIGMLNALAAQYPEVNKTFAEASEVLNYDLWTLVQEGPEDVLNQTERTQPALLAAGVAIWRLWQNQTQNQNESNPSIMAGHSLGEYSALVCAGSLEYSIAIQLVAKRGLFMQEAVPSGQGAVAAIVGLDDSTVKAICEDCAEGESVAPANYNDPTQIVVAGHLPAVERVVIKAKESGARLAIKLAVSVPAHSVLMKPAAVRLAAELEKVTIKSPQIPVINNVDVVSATDPAAIKDALIRQLYSPVRWVETIQTMANNHITSIIECGPGKVLTGLSKRITTAITTMPTLDPNSLSQALQHVKEKEIT